MTESPERTAGDAAGPYTLAELRALDLEVAPPEARGKITLAINMVGLALILAGWFLEKPGSMVPFYLVGGFLVFLVGLKVWAGRKASRMVEEAESRAPEEERLALAGQLHASVNEKLYNSDLNVVLLACLGLMVLFSLSEIGEELSEGTLAWEEWIGDLGIFLIIGSLAVSGWHDLKKNRPRLLPMRDRLAATLADAQTAP